MYVCSILRSTITSSHHVMEGGQRQRSYSRGMCLCRSSYRAYEKDVTCKRDSQARSQGALVISHFHDKISNKITSRKAFACSQVRDTALSSGEGSSREGTRLYPQQEAEKIDAGAQPASSFLFSLAPQPMGCCCSHLLYIFAPQCT